VKLEERETYHLKRRRLGISCQQVADALGVHKATVSRWETGKCPMSKDYMDFIDNYKFKRNLLNEEIG
jgi:DNA-binding transcriptional regulator YiaG